MASKNQSQRIDALEQQVSELIAGQTAMLQGQVQGEARLESKLESIGEMLWSQILTALKDQQAGRSGKGKDSLEHSISHVDLDLVQGVRRESTGIGTNLESCL